MAPGATCTPTPQLAAADPAPCGLIRPRAAGWLMADKTAIGWTEATWNPATGCDRVSAGCDNCYALTMAGRLKLMGSGKYQHDGDPRTSGPGFGLTVHPSTLDQPIRWTRPRFIFVNSPCPTCYIPASRSA